MKLTRLLPLFLMLLFLIPLVPNVHAPFKNSVKVNCASASCASASLPVSTSDLIMIHTTCYTTNGLTSAPSDSLGNQFTFLIGQVVNGWDRIYYSFSTNAGNDIVTVTQNNCTSVLGTYQFSFTFETFSGITSIGNSVNGIENTNNACASCTDSLSITAQATSIIYEAFRLTEGANNNNCATAIATGSGAILTQTDCSQLASSSFSFATFYKQLSVGGSNAFIVSWTSNSQFATSGQLLVELSTTTTTQTSVTQCYGECGNPAITLTNSNATHPVNFNNSNTLFYEFQSGLNGFLLNTTVNIGKQYSNGEQVALGVYTASCSPGTTPFTVGCAGTLQPGSGISNANIKKGRFSINTNIPVVTGEWIAIGFTAPYSGLDLNQTNGVCGDNTSGFCQNGMYWTKGTIPTSISQSALCSSGNSPCNFASISSTGLWAWINGNIVIASPLPGPSAGCTNSDLSCFMIASACGLTPSNCFIGGSFLLFAYFIAFVVGVTLCFSFINREYETEVHFPPSLFFLFFLVELFTFTAMGLIPSYVTIVIFIFTALGVAGYFGSSFSGRSKQE